MPPRRVSVVYNIEEVWAGWAYGAKASALMAFVFTLLFASLSFRYYEVWFLGLKERLTTDD